MRNQLFLGVVAALGLCSSSAWATRTNYTAHLMGDASGSAATGDALFTYDDTTKVFCGKLTYTGLEGTAQELEIQADGTSAVSLVKLPTSLASPVVFSMVLTADNVDVSNIAKTPYTNLLTSTFPTTGDGEINGTLTALDQGTGTDACPLADAGADAGKDASTSPGTTSSSSSSSSGSGTSGTTTPTDAGTGSSSSSGGCATVGDTNAASGLGLATIAGMGLALVLRGRRRRH